MLFAGRAFVPDDIADNAIANLAGTTTEDGLVKSRRMDLASSTFGRKTAEEALFRGQERC